MTPPVQNLPRDASRGPAAVFVHHRSEREPGWWTAVAAVQCWGGPGLRDRFLRTGAQVIDRYARWICAIVAQATPGTARRGELS